LAKINFVEVHLEDFVFGIPQIDDERHERFIEFAGKRFFLGEKKVLHHLLCERGAALHHAPTGDVGKNGAQDAKGIDPMM